MTKNMNVNMKEPAPWHDLVTGISENDMIPVHMQIGELKAFDDLQGGISIDPATGLREYSALREIIKNPKIRDLFFHIRDDIEENNGPSPALSKIYENAKKYSPAKPPYKSTPVEKDNPYIKKIEAMGRGGDTKLAIIPMDLALFMIELRHFPSWNPKSELLEFGFFDKLVGGGNPFKGWNNALKPKNIIRAVATIGGAILGGPVGAGIGSTVGNLATGNDIGSSIMNGLGTYGLGTGIHAIGQSAGLTGATPYTAGFFGGVNPVTSLFNPVSSWNQVSPAATGFGAPGSLGAEAMAAGASNGMSLASNVGSGLFSKLGSIAQGAAPYVPLAVMGLGMAGSKKQYQHEKEMYKRQQEDTANYRNEMGYGIPWVTPSAARSMGQQRHQNHEEQRYGLNYSKGGAIVPKDKKSTPDHSVIKSYNQGALVSGPGKGQDDKIKTSVPDGSYIIDASSTSMFGDGSTTAGSEILKEFENQIKKRFPKKLASHLEMDIGSRSEQVPVWLSEGEHKIDPVTVTMLGKGSNAKGAKLLKQMVIKLRKHKISKGDGLPPKAKHPAAYI